MQILAEKLAFANAELPWLFPLFFLLLGACVGSFLNVCVYRIPQGVSIARPRSRCACGSAIKWFDNIPVLSWFLLRGRARCCGGKFSFRYPFVECLTALAFYYSYTAFAFPFAIVAMFFFSLMLVASFIDIDTLELPDVLTVGGIVAGLAFSCFVSGMHTQRDLADPFLFFSLRSLMISATGAVVGAGLLFLFKVFSEFLLRRDAMGEGDLVLLACIGAFTGWQGAVFAVFGGSFIGAFMMAPIMLFNKIAGKKSESEMIPYGPWLAIGGVAYMFFCALVVDAHFAEVIRVFFER